VVKPDTPPISDEMLGKMTAEQLSRAGIALHLKLEAPAGSGKMYDLLMVPTRDLKKYAGKADIVATYTEVEGICTAHAATQDDDINMESLVALVRFREKAAAEGVNLMATEIQGTFRAFA